MIPFPKVERVPQPKALGRHWWTWPWLHWCVFDRECRFFGCPARLYVWPVRVMIEFRDRPFNIPFVPEREPEEARLWRRRQRFGTTDEVDGEVAE